MRRGEAGDGRIDEGKYGARSCSGRCILVIALYAPPALYIGSSGCDRFHPIGAEAFF
jgi:hypothetical protein